VDAPVVSPIAQASTTHPNREVFGFALASSLADSTVGYPSWNFDLLTTVAFFGLHVKPTGQFANDSGWATWNSSTLVNFVSTAHQHSTKVVLTIILQDFSANTPNMCAGLIHAGVTVTQTVAEVKAKGVDGVNLDYEGLDGSCGHTDPFWAQHAMTALAQQMRAGLGSSYSLSVDTYASSAADGYGFFDVRGLSGFVDSFFVMAYDLEYSNYARSPVSCPRFCLGPTSPLTAYYYNDSKVTSQYVATVGASKVILGVPYYGRKACVASAVANAFPTSSVVADTYLDAVGEASFSAVKAGSYAIHRESRSSGMERWDTWYNTTLACTRELYWDDAVSLGKKYDLVNADNLRGVGIWNLNYGGGAPELWSALRTHFIRCSGATIAASPATPQFTNASITMTASASGCTNPQFRFWIQTPGGAWSVVRDYSTSPTYTWTNTATPGNYRIEVDARANPSGPYDTYTVVADSLRMCSAAGLTSSKGSPQAPGTTVVFTATSTCPATPEYRFWIRDLAGRWGIAQDYSTTNTFAWNSTGKPQGTYGVEVDVRDQGSTAAYDRVANRSFTLYAAPCTTPSLKAAPASPGGTGSQVVLTAATTGCPNPTFRFWVQAPGGAWQVAQPYGSSNTYAWKGTGAAGAYRLEVNVRDQSSTASYQAYRDVSYQLNPCGGAALTTSKPTPEPPGTVITLAGTATCLGAPEYRFWVRAPGGVWTVKRDYSSASTFAWDTTGLAEGVYGLEVDARNHGSSAPYETVANRTFLVDACASAHLTADKTSPQAPGATVVLTGSATCLGTPQYRFWVKTPGGGWVITQDYGPAATYSWNTAGKLQGVYGLEVDVRNQGAVDAYDVVANLSFTLAVPVCGPATLLPVPASPQASGAPVTLRASTSGCPNPRYRFWIAPPGGAWVIVQDYGSSSSYSWTGTGIAGTYRLEVDVRDQSSSVAYDRVASATYVLTACRNAQLSTDRASPQKAGTSIVLSAAASCQGTPQYRFWVRDLTGRWTIVRDYSSTSTFTWNTTGLASGTYGLEVDVRNQGSTAAYETVANRTFAIT
jgi:spore germination protein YaaH